MINVQLGVSKIWCCKSGCSTTGCFTTLCGNTGCNYNMVQLWVHLQLQVRPQLGAKRKTFLNFFNEKNTLLRIVYHLDCTLKSTDIFGLPLKAAAGIERRLYYSVFIHLWFHLLSEKQLLASGLQGPPVVGTHCKKGLPFYRPQPGCHRPNLFCQWHPVTFFYSAPSELLCPSEQWPFLFYGESDHQRRYTSCVLVFNGQWRH